MKTSISIQQRSARTHTIVPGGTRGGVQPEHDGVVAGGRVDTLMGTVGACGSVDLSGPQEAKRWGRGGFMRNGMWQAGQARQAARGDGEVRVGTQTEQRAEVGGSGGARAARWEKSGMAEGTGGAAPGWGRTVPRGGTVQRVRGQRSGDSQCPPVCSFSVIVGLPARREVKKSGIRGQVSDPPGIPSPRELRSCFPWRARGARLLGRECWRG